MTVSIYQLSVNSYLQYLDALVGVMDKGAAHVREQGGNPDDLLQERLVDDMAALSFQLQMAEHHSLIAIEGVQSGEFRPPQSSHDLDYAGFRQMLVETATALRAIDADTLDSYAGKTLLFKLSDREIPFKVEDFLLSFSLPNFYFHTSMAYAILRTQGVPLGKMDYLGNLRIHTG